MTLILTEIKGTNDIIMLLVMGVTLGTLSIDDEMGRRRRSEVKFSRANLLGMR